jgi:glycosyltransferase involved in cell wall biosynthesis
MNVLHVLDISLPDLKGYAIRSKCIVEAQKNIGLNPVCLTSFRQNQYGGEKDIINGIVYYRSGKFDPRWRIPFLNQFMEITALEEKIDSVIEQEKVDVLHAHSPLLCGMAAERVGRKRSLPVVYEIRAFWEDAAVSSGKCREGDLRYMTTRYFETLVCKRADKVVAICEGIRDDLIGRKISPGKISVVPNGVLSDEFREVPRSSVLTKKFGLDGFFVLGFLGSFFRFEGVDLLVDMMQELRNEQVKLVLVGAGETFDAIRSKVAEYGLGNQIILTGNVSHQEVQDTTRLSMF